MTATATIVQPLPVPAVAVAPLDAPASSGDDLPEGFDADRPYFNGCHTVAPAAPFTPVLGPWRGAHLTLAAVVARLAYTLEGA